MIIVLILHSIGLCVLLEGEDGHCFFPSNGVQLIDCIKLVGPVSVLMLVFRVPFLRKQEI